MDCNECEENGEKSDKTAKPAIILTFKRSCLKQYICTVCPSAYTQGTNLKYHIRREHFNLISKVNGRDKRKINEVWLERVLNSDDIVEIKRTARNKYVMKKCDDPKAADIVETDGVLDLSALYPDYTKQKMRNLRCQVCRKKLLKVDYRKHLEEEHADLVA